MSWTPDELVAFVGRVLYEVVEGGAYPGLRFSEGEEGVAAAGEL